MMKRGSFIEKTKKRSPLPALVTRLNKSLITGTDVNLLTYYCPDDIVLPSNGMGNKRK